jgi:hypothetical protein
LCCCLWSVHLIRSCVITNKHYWSIVFSELIQSMSSQLPCSCRPSGHACQSMDDDDRTSHHFIISHTYSYSVLPTTCTMFCGARRRGHTQVACRRSTSDPLLPLVLCVLADADEQCTVQESMHARPGELKNGGFKLKLNNGIRLCAALDGGLGSHSFIRSFFLICSFIRS